MNWTHKNLYFSKFRLRAAIFAAIFSIFFIFNYQTVEAADTQVAVGDTSLYSKNALYGPFWMDTDKSVITYINSSQDMYYASTTDSGATWSSSLVSLGTVKHAVSWFDQQTTGDSGNLVHMAWIDLADTSFHYASVDISDGSISTVQTIAGSLTVADTTSHRTAITKTVSGNLIACFSTLSEIGCYRSTDNGVNWTSRADAYETASENDWLMLFPANTGDNDDVAGIFWDRSADELSIKMYDESVNSWTETLISTSMADSDSYINMGASVRHSDNHILLVAWNAFDTPTADLLSWDLTVDSIASPSVTAKAALLTDQIDAAQAGMVINQQNDDVYLAYAKGPLFATSVDVVYKKSTDGMGTWGSETAYSETVSDDFRAVDGGGTIDNDGGYIQFSFFNDDTNEILVNLNNDVAIAAMLNTAPNAPTLVSPSNASYTADNTPTLSANYSDDDTGDVGTTNYRISSSSLVDCTNNTNIVASGTSSETADENENTTYTPGSSIGSDATYYWCAQNNDGVATSSWTQMGSFTLDTTAPTNIGIDSVTADSSSQITIVAETASDSGAGLHSTPYWFDETSGESGATDSSSYQASTTYVDSGLSPNTQYSYRVKAKDSLDNESSYSSASSVYTLANVPSTLSFSVTNSQIVASWSANSNPSGTEYYIENTSAGTNSGWITDTNWTSSDLDCGTTYSFRVKARNADSTETSYTSSSVSTSACPSGGSVPAVPAASGSGVNTVSVGIGQTASLGNISTEGTNLLTHIRSQSDFNVNISSNGSSQNHSLVISDLDMFSKVVTITIHSEPLVFVMSPGETKKIDLDNDSIYDLQIDYTDLIVNRVELTITNLNTDTETEENYENSLIKYPNNPKVYLIENNQKRWIVDEATFNGLNYTWSDIKTISEDKVYPDGQDIKLSQSKYNFINYLSYGSVGQEVRDLQTLLKDLGYFTYPYITGYYGNITVQAVKDFQLAYGINPLGVVGPQTRDKLNNY